MLMEEVHGRVVHAFDIGDIVLFQPKYSIDVLLLQIEALLLGLATTSLVTHIARGQTRVTLQTLNRWTRYPRCTANKRIPA